ncbi:uroporphyrinogen-III synthase [Pseudoxanthomonas beigongshangi]
MASGKDAGWYVISLRPQGAHDALRRAATRRGAALLALSPWRIAVRDDDDARAALARALDAGLVLFTSPAAVAAAARLRPLQARADQIWLAVGSGTARALHRQGIPRVGAPARMDSEGLLALPELQSIAGRRIGFVTAPSGRNVLAPGLEARGAELERADVYARVDVPLSHRSVQALDRLRAPACVLISSGGALERVMAHLPAEARAKLLRMPAIAASERLAEQAALGGFSRIVLAAGPRNSQLLDSAASAVMRRDPLA